MGTKQKVNSAASLSSTTIDPDIEGLPEDVAELTVPPTMTYSDILEDINDDNTYKFARTFGIGNSAMHLPMSFTESTLTKYVRLLPARFFPFCPPYSDEYLIKFAYAAGSVRCVAAGVEYHDEIILAITIGECFSPELPDSKFETLEKSRQAIRDEVQKCLAKRSIYYNIDPEKECYNYFCKKPTITKHFPNAKDYSKIVFPLPDKEIELTTFQTAMKFMYYFCRSMHSINNIEIYVVVHAYCAMAKLGFVTPAFCHKISAAMKEEIGTDAEFNADAVRIAYNAYMKDCNISAVHYLDMLLSHIPIAAIKLRAILEQAQNLNLNVFILIGKAIKVFPSFDWLRLNEVTKGELENWAEISNGFDVTTDFPITAISGHCEQQINVSKYRLNKSKERNKTSVLYKYFRLYQRQQNVR